MKRREFLCAGCSVFAGSLLPRAVYAQADHESSASSHGLLPPWEAGVLEIHHIDTGRGNSTFLLAPDGTTCLIDAGEAHSPERLMSPAQPDNSRRAGEWIARYVQRQLSRANAHGLDRLLLTHLHGDHVGEVTADAPLSSHGDYRLTGAATVAEGITIAEVLDRGWPGYDYPALQKDPSALNYIRFAKNLAARGVKVQRASAGSLNQMGLLHHPESFGNFQARVLAVNGDVWSGHGTASRPMFPSLTGLSASALPTENMCCIALHLKYGGFRYFTGGDLTCDTGYGRYPWHDIETPVAQASGAVSVAVADHHGYYDACGPAAVRALQPRVWIVPTWHASHPAMNVLANLFSEELYPGPRLVFATGMTAAALDVTDRISSHLASHSGHVVIRVPRSANEFTVHVVNSADESGTVLSSFGPFAA